MSTAISSAPSKPTLRGLVGAAIGWALLRAVILGVLTAITVGVWTLSTNPNLERGEYVLLACVSFTLTFVLAVGQDGSMGIIESSGWRYWRSATAIFVGMVMLSVCFIAGGKRVINWWWTSLTDSTHLLFKSGAVALGFTVLGAFVIALISWILFCTVIEPRRSRRRIREGRPTYNDATGMVRNAWAGPDALGEGARTIRYAIITSPTPAIHDPNRIYTPHTVVTWILLKKDPRLLLRAVEARLEERTLLDYLHGTQEEQEAAELLIALA